MIDLSSIYILLIGTDQYFYLIRQIPLLTIEEETKLLKQVADGAEEAKQLMVKHNLALVIPVAKHYRNRGLEFIDLIQEGNIGLIKAVNNFQENKNNKFSTFATCCIKNEIENALFEKGKLIRIPVNKEKEFKKILPFMNQFNQRFPTIEEIEQSVGLSKETIRIYFQVSDYPVSLNELENDCEMKEECSLENQIIYQNLFSYINKGLNCLTEKEKKILLMRKFQEKKLREIANLYHVSESYISEIEHKALKKLKQPQIRAQNQYLFDD